MFRIEFDTRNSAFDSNDGDFEPGPEIARILQDIADRVILRNEADERITDINGNRVGTWTLTP